MGGTATLFLVLVLIFTLSSAVQGNIVELIDYYWRDYTGIVPTDAVPGGIGMNNRTSYIGQVYLTMSDGTTGLLPVALYNGTTSVTVEFFGVERRNEFLKILCSSNHDGFKWVSVDNNFHGLTYGQHLVPGGSYVGAGGSYILYIGRVKCKESFDIGRILEWRAFEFDTVMYSVCNDTGKALKSDYQVLVHIPTPKVS